MKPKCCVVTALLGVTERFCDTEGDEHHLSSVVSLRCFGNSNLFFETKNKIFSSFRERYSYGPSPKSRLLSDVDSWVHLSRLPASVCLSFKYPQSQAPYKIYKQVKLQTGYPNSHRGIPGEADSSPKVLVL